MTFEFWFMFPIAIVVATIAMSTGVGGAIFFSPIFLIALKLEPTVAIGTALITELFGFSSGLFAYLRLKLIDFKMGWQVLMFAIPAAVVGAVVADFFPGIVLKTIFGVGIIFVGTQIFTAWWGERREKMGKEIEKEQLELKDVTPDPDAKPYEKHVIVTSDGRRFEFSVFNRAVAAVYSTIGGAFLGMISVGLAELMEYQMVAKCRIPPPVAVATSIFMVVVAVLAASVGHVISFVSAGSETMLQVASISMFTAPGVLIGGQIGPFVQKIVPPETMKIVISIVFVVVGVFMLSTLTVA